MILDMDHTGLVRLFETAWEIHDQYEVTAYSLQAAEFGPFGCNQATGVRELTNYLGIQMSEEIPEMREINTLLSACSISEITALLLFVRAVLQAIRTENKIQI